MARFSKGQTVYQACLRFSENGTQVERRVIARVVDSCGAKKVTFSDRGKDSVFGRSNVAGATVLHSRADDAFEMLKTSPEPYGLEVVIYPDVVGDDQWIAPTIEKSQGKAAQPPQNR